MDVLTLEITRVGDDDGASLLEPVEGSSHSGRSGDRYGCHHFIAHRQCDVINGNKVTQIKGELHSRTSGRASAKNNERRTTGAMMSMSWVEAYDLLSAKQIASNTVVESSANWRLSKQ